jgi:hypothetical protein
MLAQIGAFGKIAGLWVDKRLTPLIAWVVKLHVRWRWRKRHWTSRPRLVTPLWILGCVAPDNAGLLAVKPRPACGGSGFLDSGIS